jgi:hypothetical protein
MPPDTEDRGDDFTPTDDDVAVVEKPPVDAAKAAADKLEADIAADKAAKDAEKTAADAADADKDTKGKAKDTRLPLARHQEILDRERERREAVETELAKYKQGEKIAEMGTKLTEAENALVELEKAYAKQLTDGEAEKAAATMSQIRRAERAINEQNAQVREQAAEARAVERVRYDVTVERLEALYPELVPESAEFDKAKVAEVLEMKEAWQAKGYTPSQALQKAVKYVMPPTTKKQEAALETEARVDPKAVEAARKAAAVAKTTDALAKTPANAAKAGADSDKAGGGAVTAKDAMKMSYKDFSALDEATLSRMRGDVV